MKKIISNSILMMILFQLASCATTAELQKAKTCKVWEEQPVVGPFYVDVNKQASDWKGRCTLFYFFNCFWVKSDMEGVAIYQDSNGIFNSRKKIATYVDNTITYEPHFLEKIISIHPIKVNKLKHNVKVRKTVKGMGTNLTGERTFDFNEACTEKQVAMGTVTLITAKNK